MMKLFKKKTSNIPRRRLESVEEHKPNLSNTFMRNRTLTGTTSDRLSSINAKSDLESPRSHVHHLSSQRRKILNIFLIVVASIIILVLLVTNFTASVAIKVTDTTISKTVKTSEYENAIQDYLQINPMGRLHFLLDTTALTAFVVNRLPEVINIQQREMTNIGQTEFVIAFRTPVAGWKINDKQYYVDSKGISFEKNYFIEPSVQIVDNSGATIKEGTVIVSNRFLSFVGRIVSLSKLSGFTVTEAILPADTTRQLDIRLSGNNFLVKLSIDRSAGEQVEDMSRAVKYFTDSNRTPEYIDVRVSNKAFFK